MQRTTPRMPATCPPTFLGKSAIQSGVNVSSLNILRMKLFSDNWHMTNSHNIWTRISCIPSSNMFQNKIFVYANYLEIFLLTWIAVLNSIVLNAIHTRRSFHDHLKVDFESVNGERLFKFVHVCYYIVLSSCSYVHVKVKICPCISYVFM